jgi:hypothetical protein
LLPAAPRRDRRFEFGSCIAERPALAGLPFSTAPVVRRKTDNASAAVAAGLVAALLATLRNKATEDLRKGSRSFVHEHDDPVLAF